MLFTHDDPLGEIEIQFPDGTGVVAAPGEPFEALGPNAEALQRDPRFTRADKPVPRKSDADNE